MRRPIGRGEYFKHTTLRILSNKAKDAHLDAVRRVTQILLATATTRTFASHGGVSHDYLSKEMRRLDRLAMLNKGAIQAKHLYQGERWYMVEQWARKLADETGESYDQLLKTLTFRMRDYL